MTMEYLWKLGYVSAVSMVGAGVCSGYGGCRGM